MVNNNTIKELLNYQHINGNIKTSGYTLSNGDKYVEIRNAQFLVTNDYIYDIPGFVDDSWYIDNYEPILNSQFDNVINLLINNYKTRQAVINISLPTKMQCTMYMHIFLDKTYKDEYGLTYIVHMRSNDCIEFRSDLQWHKKVINKIIKSLPYNITNTDIIWNADSMQLYDKYFNIIFKEK